MLQMIVMARNLIFKMFLHILNIGLKTLYIATFFINAFGHVVLIFGFFFSNDCLFTQL